MDSTREEELITGNDMNKIVSYQKIHVWKFENLNIGLSLSNVHLMYIVHFVFLLERFVCIFISLKCNKLSRKAFNITLFSFMTLKHTGHSMGHINILCSFESVSFFFFFFF